MSAAATSLPSRSRPPWLDALVGQGLALLFAFAIAVAVGSLIIILYGENPLTVYGAMLTFGFRDATSVGNILSIATPLIFAALAVSVCFKGGLFNIGVEGQFLVGMVTASWAALTFEFLPGTSHMIVVLVFACIGGMVYAAVPGILKVTTGAHEVVTTIMMNEIAISIVKFALDGPLRFTEAPPGPERRSPDRHLRVERPRPGPRASVRRRRAPRTSRGCSRSRSSPASSSGSSSNGCAWAMKPAPSGHRLDPRAPAASRSARCRSSCS